jgi:hypothetical protein
MNIKLTTIAAALLCTSMTANATGAWTDLGGGVYYDKRSVVKEKHNIIAWAMFDISEAKESDSHSYKVIKFINCKNWTTGSSYHVFYAGYRGEGKATWSGYMTQPMIPIVPESNGENLATALCGVK